MTAAASNPAADSPAADYPVTERTTATRSLQRISYDAELVHGILDEALLAHVGFVVDGRPVVLPQLHVRVGSTLYLHGSTGARALRMASGDGLAVSVTVTLVDALVLARSAFHHSINYRSVVAHGIAHVVTDEPEKRAALTALVEAIARDRAAGSREPDRKELAATTVLRLPLVEVSAKVRTGPPIDDEPDLALPHWAGLLPLVNVAGPAVPAPDLTPGIELPDHVRHWSRP